MVNFNLQLRGWHETSLLKLSYQ